MYFLLDIINHNSVNYILYIIYHKIISLYKINDLFLNKYCSVKYREKEE